MNADKPLVLAAIQQAWSAEHYPRKDRLTVLSDDDRALATEHAFCNRLALEIPDQIIDDYACWLHLFTVAARRYFLPKFLLRHLEEPAALHIFPWVLFTLDPPYDTTRFNAEYGVLSNEQKRAIQLFLQYSVDQLPAESTRRYVAADALARFWNTTSDPTTSIFQSTRRAFVGKSIRAAFKNLPYPGDDNLGYDRKNPDGAAINYDFRGYDTDEVPRHILAYHHYHLSFFSAEGRQYYLPAYMVTALDNDICGTLMPTIYYLQRDDASRFDSQYSFYAATQKAAIRQFLEYIRDESVDDEEAKEQAQKALDGYWGRK